MATNDDDLHPLTEWIRDAHYTHAEAAELMGLSEATLRGIIARKTTMIPETTARKIEAVTGLTRREIK